MTVQTFHPEARVISSISVVNLMIPSVEGVKKADDAFRASLKAVLQQNANGILGTFLFEATQKMRTLELENVALERQITELTKASAADEKEIQALRAQEKALLEMNESDSKRHRALIEENKNKKEDLNRLEMSNFSGGWSYDMSG